MQLRVLALAAVLALGFGPAHADQTFKDWWATCDNTRDCAAFGFSDQEREELAFLKVTRGAAAAEPVRARVAVSVGPGAWSLAIDGRAIPGVAAHRAEEDAESYAVIDLSPAESAVLVAAAANGSWLEVMAANKTIARISLAGSSAALRWMDDQQLRAGGVTALVAKGAKPASAMPPAPLPPLVVAAAPVSQAGLPSKPPRAVMALMNDCDEDVVSQDEAVVGRLAPGLVLWAPLCFRGAYNLGSRFTVVDEKTGKARPLSIAYGGGTEATSELMNVGYDAAIQTLSNFEKGRGLGDCGLANVWVWDGRAFAAVEQSLMAECRGVPPSEWPIVWRARQK